MTEIKQIKCSYKSCLLFFYKIDFENKVRNEWDGIYTIFKVSQEKRKEKRKEDKKRE